MNDTITYDGVAGTVSIQAPQPPQPPQPPVPPPTIYTLSDLQGFIATEQSDIDNLNGVQIPAAQSKLDDLNAQVATHATNIAAWQVYVDGITAAEQS